jgi:hypothetical protein
MLKRWRFSCLYSPFIFANSLLKRRADQTKVSIFLRSYVLSVRKYCVM